MRKDCDTCLHDEFGETYCNDCYWANGKPPTKWEPAPFWTPDTNADRIRAMSDRELADFLSGKFSEVFCSEYSLSVIQLEALKQNLFCIFMKWLKQPAEDEQ